MSESRDPPPEDPFTDPASLRAKHLFQLAQDYVTQSKDEQPGNDEGEKSGLLGDLDKVDFPVEDHHEELANWSWNAQVPHQLGVLFAAPDSSLPELPPEDTTPDIERDNRLANKLKARAWELDHRAERGSGSEGDHAPSSGQGVSQQSEEEGSNNG
ncbi:hypothetical protein M427DRAFT_153357 [Gonapodya prolifera JEL478]|uniref:Uncharacterized protein n=1 Tax=Gonapodya prolifera (strain JEL478) TaxID=1344416 RepID=A0A139AN30_GONPJ|nr:hypothetical protein M427DRAFT_153357 [Gonapodya prolifera JEL478]|eukprot:KXS18180.1 hypothetical protein M427DRAFT_153357 [Gonapodya prolifera JEL478]